MRYLLRILYRSAEYVDRRRLLSTRKDLKKCYEILKIAEDSDRETVREAYLSLAKRHHPDSGSPESDIEKFREIEAAFRAIDKKISDDRRDERKIEDVESFDIKHTAPQHRQYLNYEGAGTGTPMQREKQWNKIKANRAAQNVTEHRIAKATAAENALLDKNKTQTAKRHDIKTKYGFDRLVEDLIQEAMSKGEFNNLRGSGKPLPYQNTNPYVDFVTHKMNQVLIDNGFTPEWITLRKEIGRELEILRESLSRERKEVGNLPLSPDDEHVWSRCIQKHEALVKKINSKITHYNLVVPLLQKQMLFVSLEDEAEKILKTCVNINENKTKRKPKVQETDSSGFLDIFMSIFK